jgi:DNA-directed RNA polymerase II subunit RPB2
MDSGLRTVSSIISEDTKWITRHHLDSYNQFITSGISTMLKNMKPLVLEKKLESTGKAVMITALIGHRSVHVDKPTVISDSMQSTEPMLPNKARVQNKTYEMNVYADLEMRYTVDGKDMEPVVFDSPVQIGQVPIMVQSDACFLSTLDAESLKSVGECPYDYGGYFVVDGQEKVLVCQEKPVYNRIYTREVDVISRPDLKLVTYVQSDSPKDAFLRTFTLHMMSNNSMVVFPTRLANVSKRTDGIPIFVLFRAYGFETDRDIMRCITYTEADSVVGMAGVLHASALQAAAMGIYNQFQAMMWLKTRIPEYSNITQVLLEDIFPNTAMIVDNSDTSKAFLVRALFLGMIARKTLQYALGISDPKHVSNDRDDLTNKRIATSGELVAALFRDALLLARREMTMRLVAEFTSGTWHISKDIRNLVTQGNVGAIFELPTVHDTMVRSFKGRWGVDNDNEDTDEAGVVQELNRLSYMSYLSHIRRINNPVDRSLNLPEPHYLKGSEWGYVCPVDSPDGPNIGLVTHLSTLTRITRDQSADIPAIKGILLEFGDVTMLTDFTDTCFYNLVNHRMQRLERAYKILINDTWIGITDRAIELAEFIRTKRREGAHSASVHWSIAEGCISIHTDRGRLTRPVWNLKTESLEWVDVEESLNLLIAQSPLDVKSNPYKRYTHVELHSGVGMLSILPNITPMLQHNNAPRNAFGMAQFKQAIGVYSTAFRSRMDNKSYVLHHAQKPLFSTRMGNMICDGQHAYGENLVVAILSFSGYNQEDAILINRDAIMRGRMHVTHYETSQFDESMESANTQPKQNESGEIAYGSARSTVTISFDNTNAHKTLDADGITIPGKYVFDMDPIIGFKRTSNIAGNVTNSHFTEKAGRKHSGVVDAVAVFPQKNGMRSCKVKIRQLREPVLGDKIASRYSQKGVVGMILPQCDMPVTSSGIIPDIVINPHGFPSRNTVSHLIEAIVSKTGALMGKHFTIDAVSGGGLSHDLFDLNGEEVMYNGQTGTQIQSNVFVGINYYGRLKHMVTDKYQVRGRAGPVNAITRQPVKTQKGSGGLRIGEMEQNAIIAHGMSSFMAESFTTRSDNWVSVTEDNHIKIPYTFHLMKMELKSMNINMQMLHQADEDAIQEHKDVQSGDETNEHSEIDDSEDAMDEQDDDQDADIGNDAITYEDD